MRRSGSRFTIFGLHFLVVAGLMAAMAMGAQANWKVEGAELAKEAWTEIAIHREANLLVPALKLEVLCATASSEVFTELFPFSAEASGKVRLSSCKTFQSGTLNLSCQPMEPITADFDAKLILHNGLSYILVLPEAGKSKFGTVSFNGEFCALPEINNVTGSLVAECVKGDVIKEKIGGVEFELHTGLTGVKLCEVEETLHYMQQAPEALFTSDKLSFGKNTAFLDGIAVADLVFFGKWSGSI